MTDLSQASCFDNATADITNPDNLELAQATFNEQLLYDAIVSFARSWFDQAQRHPRILDLCAATGLAAKHVSAAIPVECITLVDTDQHALNESRKHFQAGFPVHRHCADAVTFDDGTRYDIILGNSAYHHIEDPRKNFFLKNATQLLTPGGIFILGDHFLPPHTDEASHIEAIEEFYRELVKELNLRRTDPQAVEVLRSAAKQGIYKNGEFKVCWRQFLQDVRLSSSELGETRIVWKHSRSNLPESLSGSIALCLKCAR